MRIRQRRRLHFAAKHMRRQQIMLRRVHRLVRSKLAHLFLYLTRTKPSRFQRPPVRSKSF